MAAALAEDRIPGRNDEEARNIREEEAVVRVEGHNRAHNDEEAHNILVEEGRNPEVAASRTHCFLPWSGVHRTQAAPLRQAW